MPEHLRYEDNDLFNPETHHEHSDVPVRPLFWFIVIFIVFGVASHAVLFLLYKGFAKAERNRMDPPQTQVARPADASVPKNQPLLQPFPRAQVVPYRQTPVTDLEDMRRAEKQVLDGYGWVDKQHGIVHMPIEDAKKLFAARAAVQGQTAPIVVPATSPAVPPAPSPAGNGTAAEAAAQRPAGGRPPDGGNQ